VSNFKPPKICGKKRRVMVLTL